MGGIKAVIFNWSGTVVDFGSKAPVEAFADREVTIRDDEAGGSMGPGRRHHIEALARRLPRIAAAWRHVHGPDSSGADIDQLHGIFERRINDAALNRSVLTPIARLAAAEGLAPEETVCSDDPAAGSRAIGVTLSGNGAGLGENDLAQLDTAEISRLRSEAAAPLHDNRGNGR